LMLVEPFVTLRAEKRPPRVGRRQKVDNIRAGSAPDAPDRADLVGFSSKIDLGSAWPEA